MYIEVAQLPHFSSFADDFGTVSDCFERKKVFDLRIHCKVSIAMREFLVVEVEGEVLLQLSTCRIRWG